MKRDPAGGVVPGRTGGVCGVPGGSGAGCDRRVGTMISLYPKLDCARCAASTMHRCLGAQATARGRLGYECSVCCSIQSVKAPVEPPVPLSVSDEDDPEAEIRRLGVALLGQERATDNVRSELDDALMDLQQMGVEFADATAVIAKLRAELRNERDRVGRLLTSERAMLDSVELLKMELAYARSPEGRAPF